MSLGSISRTQSRLAPSSFPSFASVVLRIRPDGVELCTEGNEANEASKPRLKTGPLAGLKNSVMHPKRGMAARPVPFVPYLLFCGCSDFSRSLHLFGRVAPPARLWLNRLAVTVLFVTLPVRRDHHSASDR